MATKEYTLTDEWEQIGSGIASVQMIEGLNLWLCVDTEAPGPDAAYDVLTIGRPSTTVYAVTSYIYARRAPNSSDVRTRIIVEEKVPYPSRVLAANEAFTFPGATIGSGFIQTANNDEWAYLSWGESSNLSVTEKSAGISLTDEPDKLWIAFADGAVTITNRMTSEQVINYHITYK